MFKMAVSIFLATILFTDSKASAQSQGQSFKVGQYIECSDYIVKRDGTKERRATRGFIVEIEPSGKYPIIIANRKLQPGETIDSLLIPGTRTFDEKWHLRGGLSPSECEVVNESAPSNRRSMEPSAGADAARG